MDRRKEVTATVYNSPGSTSLFASLPDGFPLDSFFFLCELPFSSIPFFSKSSLLHFSMPPLVEWSSAQEERMLEGQWTSGLISLLQIMISGLIGGFYSIDTEGCMFIRDARML